MATVQTNEKLRDRTVSRIERWRTKMIANAEAEYQKVLPTVGYEVYDKLVGPEFLHWAGQAPVGMLNTAENLAIRRVSDKEIGMSIPMGQERVVPAGTVRFPGGTLTCSYKSADVVLDGTHEDWEYLIEASTRLSEKRSKVRNEARELIHFTRQILREWKSLGPCLRAWPALWDLLGSDDRYRQGARPQGWNMDVPAHIGDADKVRWATAMVTQIKLMGI